MATGVSEINLAWMRSYRLAGIALAVALVLPVVDLVLPNRWQLAGLMPGIFVFAILALGLNLVTGFTGLLNIGVAAFMAIGAYVYSILTSPVFPFQIGGWSALVVTVASGALAGVLLGLPAVRLRGDYLAIVTLGFGEIVQDTLRNLEPLTKGSMGINPVPGLASPGLRTYYLYLLILVLAVVFCRNLRDSRIGRAWISIREDELAARAMGIGTPRLKLAAFATCAALCAGGGGLWAGLQGTSVEPSSYDYTLSISVLCAVIVGGLGSISGVLLGALLMFGLNQIVLVKLTDAIGGGGRHVMAQPGNWKYLIFGVALVLMMRWRPEGLLPERSDR